VPQSLTEVSMGDVHPSRLFPPWLKRSGAAKYRSGHGLLLA